MGNKRKNIANSIILIGPCGVGKSLIASQLSEKTNISLLDIDDLMFFIEADMTEELSNDKDKQKIYIEEEIKKLSKLNRNNPLSKAELEKEKELVYEFVDTYNYYYNLLGGFEQFYHIIYEYYKSIHVFSTMNSRISKINNATLKLIDKIFESTNKNFIISPPASFGWNSKNILNVNTQILQKKICEFLESTQTVLLQPGYDYKLRIPKDKTSAYYKHFFKKSGFYYENANLEISTNGLFYEPSNDFLKRKTWLDAREAIIKERLKNNSEINNICDQIIDGLNNYTNSDEILTK